MDQFALAAGCGDRERQRMQMAAAIAEQRQNDECPPNNRAAELAESSSVSEKK